MSNDNTLTVPLDRLKRSGGNVRKTPSPALEEADAQLRASIRAHGLLENLVVTDNGDDTCSVVAGARRHAALSRIAQEDGIDPASVPVPCLVVDADDATEVSLAENAVRIAMHPADQAVAFTTLAAKGATAAQIAERFGCAERTVKQNMRLGNLPAEALADYREGNLRADAAQALASTGDPELAAKVYARAKESGTPHAWKITQILNERAISSASPVALFVGADYKAAGGRMEETLFGDDPDGIRILHPDLMNKLATEKLRSVLDDLPDDDWKWTRAVLDFGWDERQRYSEASGAPGKLTEAEEAERARLQDEYESICLKSENGEISEDEAWEKADPIESRLDEINAIPDDRADYPAEIRAIAGVVATLDREGNALLITGLVHEDDENALKAAQRGESAKGGYDPDSAANDRQGGKDKLAYANSLKGDLMEMRAAAIREALARDPRAAIDLVAFTLARKLSSRGYESAGLNLQIPHAMSQSSTPFKASEDAMARLEPPPLPECWVGATAGASPQQAFAAFLDLDQADRDKTLAAAVAALLVPDLAISEGSIQQVLAEKALDVDMAKELADIGLAPLDRDLFWLRLTKAQILDAAQALGKEWVAEHRAMKKGPLATAAANAFAARKETWLPKGMAE